MVRGSDCTHMTNSTCKMEPRMQPSRLLAAGKVA